MTNNPTGIGGFRPGISGNPAGRSKFSAVIRRFAENLCEEALEVVADIMRKPGKDAAIRLSAAREILDRGVGKAATSASLDVAISVQKKLNEMSADELVQLRNALLSLEEPPLLIEAAQSSEDANVVG
jgi:hypothetical protein